MEGLTRQARRRTWSSCGRCRGGKDARRRSSCWQRRGGLVSVAPTGSRTSRRKNPGERRVPASAASSSSWSSWLKTISSAPRPRARGSFHVRWVCTKSCSVLIEHRLRHRLSPGVLTFDQSQLNPQTSPLHKYNLFILSIKIFIFFPSRYLFTKFSFNRNVTLSV